MICKGEHSWAAPDKANEGKKIQEVKRMVVNVGRLCISALDSLVDF